jgi:hypothetical protein
METEAVESGTGMLCCMNEDGDKRIMWDSSNRNETSEAEKVFDEYKAKGYMAYRTDKHGQRGEIIDTFDVKAERIIMQPQMVGG